MTRSNSLRSLPDATGHFGDFGGRYVAETLMPLILDLEKAYEAAKVDPANVREAIGMTGARMVDVSSGVESAPGVKDVDKIAAFLQAVGAS